MTKTVETIAEMTVIVKKMDDGSARVEMTSEYMEFGDLMIAAEFLLWVAGTESGLPFEEAMRRLCQGAREYEETPLPLTVIGKDDEEK